MKRPLSSLALALLSVALIVPQAAQARDGQARTSVNRAGNHARNANVNANHNVNANRNVNSNRNVNRNVNVNRDVHVDVDHHGGGWYDDDDYHPLATAAAVTATVAVTSAVIGSITRTLPPSCVPVGVGGVTYQQCGSTWYQPQYAGTTVQYVVVNPPR
ncbi:hypothetical protein [Jeongeupia chitinilytica]|uniref:Secreted protein n=1 Tax=Jeongeupia chitinilytica TaxID=1041641 RepID=A0ABQ3H172_9NEIS|nr:hypothetical protein [Jeongeupia chitinilytica]GHD65332.1 hypothetical protein GCM10007350_25600 [Jeongeupia chitinilytica]